MTNTQTHHTAKYYRKEADHIIVYCLKHIMIISFAFLLEVRFLTNMHIDLNIYRLSIFIKSWGYKKRGRICNMVNYALCQLNSASLHFAQWLSPYIVYLYMVNYEQPPARIRFATSRWRLSQHKAMPRFESFTAFSLDG